jgi:peroxiredoxin
MNSAVYSSITMILGVTALIALGIALYSFIFMLVRWKTPKRRSHAVRLFAAIAAIPCLIAIQQAILWWVFLPALGRQQMAEINAARAKRLDETTFVKVGDTVPEFSLTTIDGDTVSLPLPGKVVLINFFATWCGPCQMELPHIERIWSDFRNDDRFGLVVVGREETAETVRAYRQQHQFSFPIAADPEREVYSFFAKESIPRTILVSPEGLVVYSNAGFYETDIEELRAELKKQLATLK